MVASKAARRRPARSAGTPGGAANGRAMLWRETISLSAALFCGSSVKSMISGTLGKALSFCRPICSVMSIWLPSNRALLRLSRLVYDQPHRHGQNDLGAAGIAGDDLQGQIEQFAQHVGKDVALRSPSGRADDVAFRLHVPPGPDAGTLDEGADAYLP